ncbi:unnamed protein product [Caenorhabditis nigoni]
MPPPGLTSLILYDFSDWKTAQRSYENFGNICVLTKIPAISLVEFETTFYGVLKDKYHRQLNFRILAKIDNLKLCILSDVLAGKSFETSYKDMSETFGAENIDFLDMDFWFYRFYHGNYDLSYDRSLDSKPLEFLNLPIIIHHKIIDNLDLKSQLSLRRVSKSLKNIVDQGKPVVKEMIIGFSETDIIIACDDLFARYSEDLGVDYRKIALNYVMILLKNPKLRLDLLHIVSFCPLDPLFIDFFQNFEFQNFDESLTSGCEISRSYESFSDLGTDEIVKLDQWKCLNIASFFPVFSGPIDCFLGFSFFFVTLPDVTEEHLMKMKERLSKSQNFECCNIRTIQDTRVDLIVKVFPWSSRPEYDNVAIQYTYTIPDSGNTLKIRISWRHLMFEMIRLS